MNKQLKKTLSPNKLKICGKWLANGLTTALLMSMAIIPCVELIGRQLFDKGIPNATDYLRHLTLWVGMLGAVLATRDKKHLRISGTQEWLPAPIKRIADIWTPFVASMVCWSLAGASLQLVVAEAPPLSQAYAPWLPSFIINWLQPFGLFDSGNEISVAGWLPRWMAEAIMPIGFFLMGVVFVVFASPPKWWAKLIVFLSLPAVIALSVIYPMGPIWAFWTGLALLLGSALLGAPIFVLMGGCALLLFWSDGVTTSAISAEMYRIVVSPVFPTIPLFTLAGFVLSESRASERLVNVFQAFFGWFPGGTAVAVTLLCAFFTTFTGASGITILALGGLLLPVLMKSGSSERFSIGLLTATGSLGLLFPPSLVVILYCVIAKVPIVDMFKASLVPGVLMVLPVCVLCVFRTIKGKHHHSSADEKDDERVKFDHMNILKAIWAAKWELMIPVVALAGIFGGFCTLVETAALTVLYSFFVEAIIHRDLKFLSIYQLLLKCSILVGGVLIVLGVAMGLTCYLVDAQVPTHAAEWASTNLQSRWVFLLALNVALIITGCLMDIYSALIVVVPLILPMAEVFGVNPIHLGVIFLANLELGYLTPPVGMNLFLAAFRFEKSLLRVARDALPFLFIYLIVVLVITYVPWLSIGIMKLW